MSELKPFEVPCPKCGSGDINRVFKSKDSTTSLDDYRKTPTVFLKVDNHNGWKAYATQDHIFNHCRCCHYEWAVKTLKKKKAPQPPKEIE